MKPVPQDGVRSTAKAAARAVFISLALPLALLTVFGRSKACFTLMAQLLSMVPGMPGDYLRRGFYTLTLRRCSFENRIGFGSFFAHPEAELGFRAAIGEHCIIGKAILGDRVLVSSRSQILSGFRQHSRDADGLLTGEGVFETVTISDDVWIGAGSVVMAGIGPRTSIGAGSVVFRALPADAIATGNPARVVDERTSVPASIA